MNALRNLSLLLTVLVVLGSSADSRANEAAATSVSEHPISLVYCDMFVNRAKITMRLQSAADDLELIQGVMPMETGLYDAEELRLAMKDHGKFLLERIEIFNAAGDLLSGRIIETEPFEIPDQGVMSGKLMEYTMGWTIEYTYDEAPEFLTLQHDIVDENYLFPSELNLVLKQAGSDTPYSKILKPGEPETIRFDWDLPPLDPNASGEEWRDWFEEQRQKTLGITSYSSVYSFIYITPREVRQEILIPLASLAAMIKFEQADPSYLEIAEQDAAIEVIEEFFSTGNPISIDGNVIEPRFDRIDFYGLDLRDFAIQAERRRITMANGRVGIIMAYPSKQIPDRVDVIWDKFSTSLMNVDAVVFAPEKTEKAKFSKFLTENSYRWNNPGVPPLPEIVPVKVNIDQKQVQDDSIPRWLLIYIVAALILSFVLAKFVSSKAGLMAFVVLLAGFVAIQYALPESQPAPTPQGVASDAFRKLHGNLFAAFDYYEEDDVYDALAASTDGPMLQDIYLKMRKSLEVQEQGGAVAHINEINIAGISPYEEGANGQAVEAPGFSVRCQWNLVGTIEHWGHIHQRTNTYDAVFNVKEIDGAWKLVDYETLDEKQGVVKTSLRKF